MICTAAAIAAPVAATLVTTLAPSLASAQDYTNGTLRVIVKDGSGAPVPGATVAVKSSQGGTRTATADSNGVAEVSSLPYGTYTAKVTAPGFSTDESPVSVAPSGSNYTFNLASTSSGGTVGEVVVRGARATQAFARTETGLDVNVQQLATRVPVGRSISSIALLTPGATIPDASIVANGVRRDQTTVTLSGTSAAESVYYINGLNVTDQRTFLGYSDLPFDAIQNVDVKSGGYQSEFGRATGGVINIVTRSGSNEYHAGGSIFYSPDGPRGTSPDAYTAGSAPGYLILNSYAKSQTLDSDVWLSGPIIKDHLFVFGIFNPRDVSSSSAVASDDLARITGTQSTYKDNSPRWLAKVDFNLTDKQRLEATVFSDKQTTDEQDYTWDIVGDTRTESGSTASHAGGLNQIYRYTGVWTNWFTLSALYGKVESNYTDTGPSLDIPYVVDRTRIASPQNPSGGINYLTSNTNPGPFDLSAADTRETYRVDGDVFVHFLGSHHFRAGYDLEKLLSTDSTEYSGGAYTYIYNTATTAYPSGVSGPGGDYARVTVYKSGGAFKATQSAVYLQDSWDLTPTLNLQLGVRDDIYDYKTASNESFIKTSKQWAPRLGVTWDPFAQGVDKLYGSYGRYYLPIATNTAIREAAASPFYRDYYNASRDGSGSLILNPDGTPVLGANIGHLVFSADTAPDPRTVAAQNIKPMYENEFIIGYQHQFLSTWNHLADGITTGVSYTDRKLGSTIEDTQLLNTASRDAPAGPTGAPALTAGDLYGPIANYCTRTGVDCSAAGDYIGFYTLINPGSPAVTFLDLDGTGPKYVTLTAQDLDLPKAERHYQALEFTFNRPFDGKWGLQGSYVLSRSRGNYEGAVNSDLGQTDTSITQSFDADFFTYGQYGYLPNDHRHTIKLFGTYSPIEDLSLGANFTAQSGRHYGCIGYSIYDATPGPTPSEFSCNNVITPRGSVGVTPWMTDFDFSLAYTLPLRDNYGNATISLDIFNAFNSHAITRVVEQGEVSGFPGTLNQVFALPRSYQAPRSFRIGLRYSY